MLPATGLKRTETAPFESGAAGWIASMNRSGVASSAGIRRRAVTWVTSTRASSGSTITAAKGKRSLRLR